MERSVGNEYVLLENSIEGTAMFGTELGAQLYGSEEG